MKQSHGHDILLKNEGRRDHRPGRPILAFLDLLGFQRLLGGLFEFFYSLHSFIHFLSFTFPTTFKMISRVLLLAGAVAQVAAIPQPPVSVSSVEEVTCSTIYNTLSYASVETVTLSDADAGK